MQQSKRRNRTGNSFTSSQVAVDPIDRKILAELSKSPRTSVAGLSKRIGMSRPAVAERIRRLEESSVIAGWTVQLNPVSLGLPLTVVIRIRPMPRQLATVADLLRSMPWVVECLRITGEDCYLARAHVPSVSALEQLIDRIQPYGQTTTSVVQSTPVPFRQPPLPGPVSP